MMHLMRAETNKTATIQTAPNSYLSVVQVDGTTIGNIYNMGKTFKAARKLGTLEDPRKISNNGFRSIEKATAWILESVR